MSYLILSFFSVFLLFSSGVLQHDNATDAGQYQTDTQQQAAATLRYMNAINSYLYAHPMADGTFSDSLLEAAPPSGVRHVIRQGRVFVYQPSQPGLKDALVTVSRHSALLGSVKSRRLIDLSGTDMQITLPDLIPEGYLVYLN
ncbi:type IV pilus biogenesis protein PilM [Buttiauxella agrestis]|uniref:type IV pilus biogenesis protein PilM n=1 Tax=Buttiauxella agrestis TaxID=82977 RepID=UPI0039757365